MPSVSAMMGLGMRVKPHLASMGVWLLLACVMGAAIWKRFGEAGVSESFGAHSYNMTSHMSHDPLRPFDPVSALRTGCWRAVGSWIYIWAVFHACSLAGQLEAIAFWKNGPWNELAAHIWIGVSSRSSKPTEVHYVIHVNHSMTRSLRKMSLSSNMWFALLVCPADSFHKFWMLGFCSFALNPSLELVMCWPWPPNLPNVQERCGTKV